MNNVGFHEVPAKDYKGRRMYCGRFALIAATGCESFDVTLAINTRRHRPDNTQIMGTSVSELRCALASIGVPFTYELVNMRPGKNYKKSNMPTLAQWIRKEQHSSKATYIVLITNHWIVVRGDWLTDTFNRTPHDLSVSNPYARKRVQAVIKIHQQEQTS